MQNDVSLKHFPFSEKVRFLVVFFSSFGIGAAMILSFFVVCYSGIYYLVIFHVEKACINFIIVMITFDTSILGPIVH